VSRYLHCDCIHFRSSLTRRAAITLDALFLFVLDSFSTIRKCSAFSFRHHSQRMFGNHTIPNPFACDSCEESQCNNVIFAVRQSLVVTRFKRLCLTFTIRILLSSFCFALSNQSVRPSTDIHSTCINFLVFSSPLHCPFASTLLTRCCSLRFVALETETRKQSNRFEPFHSHLLHCRRQQFAQHLQL
jgi:hypothetical protein